MASSSGIKEAELKWKVLNRKVKNSIADAGASSSCGRPEVSECGNTDSTLTYASLPTTKQKKKFQYAGGTIATADNIKQFTFKVQEGAKDSQMIPGIQNNLLSTNQVAKAKYILRYLTRRK